MEWNIVSFASQNEGSLQNIVRSLYFHFYNKTLATNHRLIEGFICSAAKDVITRSYIANTQQLTSIIRRAKEQPTQQWHLIIEGNSIQILKHRTITTNIIIDYIGEELPQQWEHFPIATWHLPEHILTDTTIAALEQQQRKWIKLPIPSIDFTPINNQARIENVDIMGTSPTSITMTRKKPSITNLLWMLYCPPSKGLLNTTTSLFTGSCSNKINTSHLSDTIELLASINPPLEVSSAHLITASSMQQSWFPHSNSENSMLNSVSQLLEEHLQVRASGITRLSLEPKKHTLSSDKILDDVTAETLLQNFYTNTLNTSILLLHGDSKKCITRACSSPYIATKRDFLYVIITNDTSLNLQNWLMQLHHDGFFNILDLSSSPHQIHNVTNKPQPASVDPFATIKRQLMSYHLDNEEAIATTRPSTYNT